MKRFQVLHAFAVVLLLLSACSNDDPVVKKLRRTGTVNPDASVKLIQAGPGLNADLNDASLEEVDAYLKTVDRLTVQFWFTVAGGRITAIEEQYLP